MTWDIVCALERIQGFESQQAAERRRTVIVQNGDCDAPAHWLEEVEDTR